MTSPIVRETNEGVILAVHVQPKASKSECIGLAADAVKIRVAAPPVDGTANEALTRFLAARFAIPRSHVQIQFGDHGRHKRLLIRGVTSAWVYERLGLPRTTERRT